MKKHTNRFEQGEKSVFTRGWDAATGFIGEKLSDLDGWRKENLPKEVNGIIDWVGRLIGKIVETVGNGFNMAKGFVQRTGDRIGVSLDRAKNKGQSASVMPENTAASVAPEQPTHSHDVSEPSAPTTTPNLVATEQQRSIS